MKFFVENAHLLTGWSGFLKPAVGMAFIILTLIFAAMALWRRSAAAVRHLAWTITFLCLLCLPVFVRYLPSWPAPAWMVSSGWNSHVRDSLSIVWQNESRPKFGLSPSVAVGARHATGAPRPPAEARPAVAWSELAVMIWFAGTMLGLARLLIIQFRLGRLAGRMTTCDNREWLSWIDDWRAEYRLLRPVKLLIFETSASPMTWGYWRPVIALPAGALQWPEDRLRLVLRHELAHVKRWDCLTQAVADVVCALYWFNPLAWLAARRMRAEREKACDDFVLNAGARPSEYAGHLVAIARQFASVNLPGAVAMTPPAGLEQRVRAILDGRQNRNRITPNTAAFIVITVFGLVWMISGCSSKHPADRHKDGLIGSWSGDGNAVDSVGGKSGVPIHVLFTNGVSGRAFLFDPDRFPYATYVGVQIPDQPAYALTHSLTIEAWIRPRGNGYMIFFRGDHRPGLDPYCLSMDGKLNLAFAICAEDSRDARVQVPVGLGAWIHVAAVLDDRTGTMSLYTNGVLAAKTVTTVRPFGDLQADQSPGIGIGNVNDGGNDFPFIGEINAVALYDRALSADEIHAAYAENAANARAQAEPLPTRASSFRRVPTPELETGSDSGAAAGSAQVSDDAIRLCMVGVWALDSRQGKVVENKDDGTMVVKINGVETATGTWRVRNGYLIADPSDASSKAGHAQTESNKVLRLSGDTAVLLSIDGHTQLTFHRQ